MSLLCCIFVVGEVLKIRQTPRSLNESSSRRTASRILSAIAGGEGNLIFPVKKFCKLSTQILPIFQHVTTTEPIGYFSTILIYSGYKKLSAQFIREPGQYLILAVGKISIRK
jgi:hypothetical protein